MMDKLYLRDMVSVFVAFMNCIASTIFNSGSYHVLKSQQSVTKRVDIYNMVRCYRISLSETTTRGSDEPRWVNCYLITLDNYVYCVLHPSSNIKPFSPRNVFTETPILITSNRIFCYNSGSIC